MVRAPVVAKWSPAPEPQSSTSLGLCSAAVYDSLRPILIDTFISGGKHLVTKEMMSHSQLWNDIERDYGPYLTVQDDATVEGVDKTTGKVTCRVTYELDLQGLAGQVLQEGALGRAAAPDPQDASIRQGYPSAADLYGRAKLMGFNCIP